MLASQALYLLRRNRALERSTGVVRPVRSNLPFSPLIVEEFGHLIAPFTDLYSMPKWRDSDVVIDELSVYFDSHEWERTTQEVKRFLRLHRHYRVNIWGVAQDFLTVDKSFRRLVKRLYHINRIIGTQEPSPYKKPQKYPFTWSYVRGVDEKTWDEEKENYRYIMGTSSMELFTKKDFQIFDTHADLADLPLPPLKREIRVCPEDGFTRKRYI